MILGFQRNVGVQASLGIGEHAPLFKELKEGLDEAIRQPSFWSSYRPKVEENETDMKIQWKQTVDRGGGNCHAISGILDFQNEGVTRFKERINSKNWNLKGVFSKNGCKMIELQYLRPGKGAKKYGFGDPDPGKIVIVIKYAKMK